MSTATLVVLTFSIVAGSLPVVLVLQFKSLAASRFRSKLWQLRDDLMDDLLFGRIAMSDRSRLTLRATEAQIKIAGRHTMIDLLLATAVYRNQELRSLKDEILEAEGPVADRQALIEYVCRLQDASMSHLFRGSVFGWLAGRISAALWTDPVRQAPRTVAQAPNMETTIMPELAAKLPLVGS